MINTSNLRKNPQFRNHNRVAGTLPNDTNIEFIGIPSTRQVIWFQYGNQHSFSQLPKKLFELLSASFYKDIRAYRDISAMAHDYERQVELYTYYIYGDADLRQILLRVYCSLQKIIAIIWNVFRLNGFQKKSLLMVSLLIVER